MAQGRDGDLKAKLSRKIAELTMVVHLLFTRNHEREIEVDAIKAAYEHEIKIVQEEMKGKITWLEGQLDELEKFRVLLDVKTTESEKDKQFIKHLQEKEAELKASIEQKEHLLGLAKRDILDLKGQLDGRSRTDTEEKDVLASQLEALRKENTEFQGKVKSKAHKLRKCNDHIEELQTKILKLTTEIQDLSSENEKLKSQLDGLEFDWQDEIKQLQRKATELKNQGEEDRSRVEKLEWKNKQLSQHGKDLEDENRHLELRIQQIINERNSNKKKPKKKMTTPEAPRSSPETPVERDEEIARLKREIQRYRLELSNRESNFNRVFAGHKPVLVGAKGQPGNITPEPVFPNLTGARKRSSASGQMTSGHLPLLNDPRVGFDPR